jgi:hypothetical protein
MTIRFRHNIVVNRASLDALSNLHSDQLKHSTNLMLAEIHFFVLCHPACIQRDLCHSDAHILSYSRMSTVLEGGLAPRV